MYVELISEWSSSPDIDQIWFVRRPIVTGPFWRSTAAVGPSPHCFSPRMSFVAEGRSSITPTPHIQPLSVCFGEKNWLAWISPRPDTCLPGIMPSESAIGMIVLVIRFHYRLVKMV